MRQALLAACGLLLVWGLPAAATPTPGVDGVGSLGRPGDRVADATIERVELHAEFERYHLRWPDGRTLPVEVVPASHGDGACSDGGATIFPRWELVGGTGEEDTPAAVAVLCQRLVVAAPDFETLASSRAQPAAAPALPDQIATENALAPPIAKSAGRLRASPLHGVLVGIGLLVVLLLPKGLAALGRADRRTLLGVAGVGAVLRLGLSPRQVYLGSGAGYEALTLAWGTAPPHPLYGGGMAALFGPWLSVLGRTPLQHERLSLLLSLAAPVLAWVFGRLVEGPRLALLLGLLVAVLPMHLLLSATEVAQGPVFVFLWLALAAVACLLHERRPWRQIALGLIAGGAAGFCGHLRPEALPVAALPVLLIGCIGGLPALRSPGAFVLLVTSGLLVLARLVVLSAGGAARSTAMDPLALLDSRLWLMALRPYFGEPCSTQSFQVYLHAWWTPVAWMLLAVVGALRGPRRLVLFAGLCWVVLGLPLLPKSWPLADAVRLQLQATPAWLLLTGLGALVVAERLPNRLRPWLPWVLVIVALPRLPWVLRPWANQAEQALIERAVEAAPPGTTLLTNPDRPHSESFAQVWEEAGAGRLRLRPMGHVPPTPGDWALVDVLCHNQAPGAAVQPDDACARLQARCDLAPIDVAVLAGRSDLDLQLPAWFEVGAYRVGDCRD